MNSSKRGNWPTWEDGQTILRTDYLPKRRLKILFLTFLSWCTVVLASVAPELFGNLHHNRSRFASEPGGSVANGWHCRNAGSRRQQTAIGQAFSRGSACSGPYENFGSRDATWAKFKRTKNLLTRIWSYDKILDHFLINFAKSSNNGEDGKVEHQSTGLEIIENRNFEISKGDISDSVTKIK